MRKFGFKFHSDYLNSDCTVVFYLSDKHWWFKSKRHNKIMKAGTPLSYFVKKEK